MQAQKHLFLHILSTFRLCLLSVTKLTLRQFHAQQIAKLDLRYIVRDILLIPVSNGHLGMDRKKSGIAYVVLQIARRMIRGAWHPGRVGLPCCISIYQCADSRRGPDGSQIRCLIRRKTLGRKCHLLGSLLDEWIIGWAGWSEYIPSSPLSNSHLRNRRPSSPWELCHLSPTWRCIRAALPAPRRQNGLFRVRASVFQVQLRREEEGRYCLRPAIGSSWLTWKKYRP